MSALPTLPVRKLLKAPIRVIYSRDDIAAPLPDHVKEYPDETQPTLLLAAAA